LRAIAERHPPAAGATVKDFADHIDHGVKLMGIDHVGISSDFDGGGGVDGYSCALEAINVTTELVRRGYTEEQIAKIWSGNLLRVLGEVERTARRIQTGELRS
jgi:membrane dipeptidase